MGASVKAVGETLVRIAGREGVRDDGPALARAAVDGVTPQWVVAPASLPALSAVLALAYDAGLAVQPRGSGSTLALGHPPERVDVALDLQRLDQILEYSPDDLTVTVQAGVTAGALAARLAGRRQMLPLDPPGAVSRTLGGLTATNASGPLRARWGTLRDLLLGVRFVQADGVVTWGGAKVVKSVSGYDVPKLMVGSLGTLGVLTELTFRLHPVPEFEASWIATFARLEAAQAFAGLVLDSTLQPNRLELLNEAMLRMQGLTGVAAVAMSIGSVEASVRAQGEQAGTMARRSGGNLTPARGDFWETYASMAADSEIQLRVGTLPTQVVATTAEVERVVAGLPRVRAAVSGSCTTGALRIGLAGVSVELATDVIERVRSFVAPVGGSCVIERGPRALRAAVDPWGPVETEALGLMRTVKAEFDPRRVLNPGRFVGGL